jgi:hypothetical protein
VITRKPTELPPDVARAFVEDMRAYFAEENQIKRDGIAVRQLRGDKCLGHVANSHFKIDPSWILEKYLADVRLDERWRSFQLASSVLRLPVIAIRVLALPAPMVPTHGVEISGRAPSAQILRGAIGCRITGRDIAGPARAYVVGN